MVGGRRYCRAGYASLSSVCTNYAYRLSMPDETVETRPPWLDFSLPRRPCLGISVLCSIILQSLNSCAIRLPDSTACPHHLLPPLTLRLIMCWSSPAVRTARCSQPAMLPTRHAKFAGGYAVCSEEYTTCHTATSQPARGKFKTSTASHSTHYICRKVCSVF